MGKYKDLINNLLPGGKFSEANYPVLVEADRRAVPPLVQALHTHENESIRETCAEILGERKAPEAIPALIEALEDESLFVRQDALWSIERICLYQRSALVEWLDLDCYAPAELRRKVCQWWKVNRRFIENNPNLG